MIVYLLFLAQPLVVVPKNPILAFLFRQTTFSHATTPLISKSETCKNQRNNGLQSIKDIRWKSRFLF